LAYRSYADLSAGIEKSSLLSEKYVIVPLIIVGATIGRPIAFYVKLRYNCTAKQIFT